MKALRFFLVVGCAFAVLWLVGELGARWYLHRALSQGWPTPSGQLAGVLTLFPPHSVNECALTLEMQTRQLGIDIAPRTKASRVSERPISDAWGKVKAQTKDYIQESLETKSSADVVPPPVSVAAFLTANDQAIRSIESTLTMGEPPLWPENLHGGFDSPIPNLLGNIDLTRLLVAEALLHRSRGENDLAWRDLRAASRLPDGLFRSPYLICQLIAFAETSVVVGTMRKLTGAPPQWALSWPSDNLPIRFRDAVVGEAAQMYMPFDSPPTADLFRAFSSEDRPTPRGRALSLAFSPYLRASAANTAMAHRELLRQYAALSPCDQHVVLKTNLQTIPRWNKFGRVAFIGEALGSSYRRLHVLLAHIEGTRLILRARMEKERTGVWPLTAPAIDSPCHPHLWDYGTDSFGHLHLHVTSLLAPPSIKNGLVLPQEDVEQ